MTDANQIAKQAIIEQGAEDLLLFGKVLAPATFEYKSAYFHREVADIMIDRSIKQFCIEAPRGFAKSTLALLGVMHHIAYDRGNKIIVIQSKTQKETIERLNFIKNVLESERFIALFGYAGERVAKTWTDRKVSTTLNGENITIYALGGAMPLRGALSSGRELKLTRITFYLVDDPEDEDNTKTPEAMAHNMDKFDGNRAGLDPKRGRVGVIGTPLKGNCLVEVLMNTEGWVTRKYQAWWKTCECGHQSDPLVSTCEKCGEIIDTKPIEYLWEELHDYQALINKFNEHKSKNTPAKFYSELMCRITGNEDQLFRREQFNYYEGYLEVRKMGGSYDCYIHITSEKNVELEKEKIIPVNTFIGIDPASSRSGRADFTVIFPIGYDADKNIYCLPYYRKRETPAVVAEAIIDRIKLNRPKMGGIETNNYQEMLRGSVHKMMVEQDCVVAGFDTGQGFNARTEKNERLKRLHDYFYHRKVWLMKSEHLAFIDELLAYPRGSHDDTLDAFDYATRRMYRPDHMVREETLNDLKYLFPELETKNNWQAPC